MLKKAKEQQEEMAKRAEQLLMDYPSLIMKFTLLIQAGMTARKVFQKMSADYIKNRPKTGRYAYEAITIMCHEMDSGVCRTGSISEIRRKVRTDEVQDLFHDSDTESAKRQPQDGGSSGKRSTGSVG